MREADFRPFTTQNHFITFYILSITAPSVGYAFSASYADMIECATMAPAQRWPVGTIEKSSSRRPAYKAPRNSWNELGATIGLVI
jgi:hypothetical protein